MQTMERDKQLTDYLLGELPEWQREELEERFYHDADLFERMLALQDELIDDHLRGELSARQSKRFERYFLATPRQRERVESARALLRAIAEQPAAEAPAPARIEAEPVSWWRLFLKRLGGNRLVTGMAFAIALLLITVTGGMIFEMRRLHGELTQARQQQQELQGQVANERARADRLADTPTTPSPLPGTTPPPRPGEDVIASLVLTSDYDQGTKGPRGGGLQKLVIPSERGLVRLRLKLTRADYPGYRVTLIEVSSGKTVQTLDGLRGRAGQVVAQFPASSFSGPARDYLVVLDGKTADGKYETEIEKYSFRTGRK
jgi:hypothetical protein